jgi:hypothetical protein
MYVQRINLLASGGALLMPIGLASPANTYKDGRAKNVKHVERKCVKH